MISTRVLRRRGITRILFFKANRDRQLELRCITAQNSCFMSHQSSVRESLEVELMGTVVAVLDFTVTLPYFELSCVLQLGNP
jgi:hypothetical protein